MKDILKNINYYINFYMNQFMKIYKNSPSSEEKEIIIIKPDRIGDFILWIKSLESIINTYTESKITIVCDKSVVQLLEVIKNLKIKIISIDREKFLLNLYYRWKILKRLKGKKYYIAINPLYSRDFLSESLLESIIADKKIGINGDDSNLNSKLLERYNKNYTKLYTIPNSCIHELEINKNFIKKICGLNNNSRELKLEFDRTRKIKEKYIVIFLGSSSPKKQWNIEKFIGIEQEFPLEYTLVLLGGSSELKIGEIFQKNISKKRNIRNLIGKTNMKEVCNYIYNSNLVITNDTFAVHLSTLLEKDSLCIVGGGHFGRFLPYPGKSFKILPKVIFHKMDCFGCKWKCKYATTPYHCINIIKEEEVILKIKNILVEKNNL